MGLPKGRSNNYRGRPKGSVNKTSIEARIALCQVVNGEIKVLKKSLSELNSEKRIEVLIKLLPFILGKPQSIDLELESGERNGHTPFQALENARFEKSILAEVDIPTIPCQ